MLAIKNIRRTRSTFWIAGLSVIFAFFLISQAMVTKDEPVVGPDNDESKLARYKPGALAGTDDAGILRGLYGVNYQVVEATYWGMILVENDFVQSDPEKFASDVFGHATDLTSCFYYSVNLSGRELNICRERAKYWAHILTTLKNAPEGSKEWALKQIGIFNALQSKWGALTDSEKKSSFVDGSKLQGVTLEQRIKWATISAANAPLDVHEVNALQGSVADAKLLQSKFSNKTSSGDGLFWGMILIQNSATNTISGSEPDRRIYSEARLSHAMFLSQVGGRQNKQRARFWLEQLVQEKSVVAPRAKLLLFDLNSSNDHDAQFSKIEKWILDCISKVFGTEPGIAAGWQPFWRKINK